MRLAQAEGPPCRWSPGWKSHPTPTQPCKLPLALATAYKSEEPEMKRTAAFALTETVRKEIEDPIYK